MAVKKNIGLEDSLKKLEAIVTDIEAEDLSLEESLKKFEEGVQIYNQCKKSLGDIEKKIKILSESLEEDDFE